MKDKVEKRKRERLERANWSGSVQKNKNIIMKIIISCKWHLPSSP